jgi:hypothetical protein
MTPKALEDIKNKVLKLYFWIIVNKWFTKVLIKIKQKKTMDFNYQFACICVYKTSD